jgi:hypothetical protein
VLLEEPKTLAPFKTSAFYKKQLYEDIIYIPYNSPVYIVLSFSLSINIYMIMRKRERERERER